MSNKSITLTLLFGNETITIAKNSVYRLLAGGLHGVSAADYLVSLDESALIDGGYVSAEKFLPRNINIAFSVTDLKNSETYREYLVSTINPLKAGTLIIGRSGVTRKINFKVQGAPTFEQNNIFVDRLHVYLNLVCPDPWFHDVSESEADFVETVPLLTFPFNSIQGAGITAGTIHRSTSTTVNNTGDAPTGVTVTIVANDTVTNPYVQLGTQKITANCVMDTNDKIQFSTVSGAKDIRLNGAQVLNYSRQSVFFDLPLGKSTIEVGAKSGAKSMSATVRYALKYLGV